MEIINPQHIEAYQKYAEEHPKSPCSAQLIMVLKSHSMLQVETDLLNEKLAKQMLNEIEFMTQAGRDQKEMTKTIKELSATIRSINDDLEDYR